jgi:toluene monooxygenase system ferredoxin subunit
MPRDLRHLPVYPSGGSRHESAEPHDVQASRPGGEWRRVCAAGDVPRNGMKAFMVDGVGVLVVDTGEAFFAVEAMCPHESVPLERGVVEGSTLTCLEHLWQFDVRTGASMGEAEEGLRTYRLKAEDGHVYVAF